MRLICKEGVHGCLQVVATQLSTLNGNEQPFRIADRAALKSNSILRVHCHRQNMQASILFFPVFVGIPSDSELLRDDLFESLNRVFVSISLKPTSGPLSST